MTAFVTNLQFSPAHRLDVASGLLGWARFSVGALRLDGVAVRVTLNGDLALSYPTRRDSQNREHTVVLPTTRSDEIAIERAVIAELRRRGHIQ